MRAYFTSGAQIAAALGRAHEAGIVHRDISTRKTCSSPNQLVAAKVLDVGIARRYAGYRAPGVVSEAATEVAFFHEQEGALHGTPGYLVTPSRRAGDAVRKSASDRHLPWGVLLLRAFVSGVRPFGVQGDHGKRWVAVMRDEPAHTGERCDPALEVSALVHRCLEKDPSKRPPNARELGGALAEGLASKPKHGSRVRPPRGASKFLVCRPPRRPYARGSVARGVLLGRGARRRVGRSPLPSGARGIARRGAARRSSFRKLAASFLHKGRREITELPITGTSNPAARAAYQEACGAFRRVRLASSRDPPARRPWAKDDGFVAGSAPVAHLEATSSEVAEADGAFRWVSEHGIGSARRASPGMAPWVRGARRAGIPPTTNAGPSSSATACRRFPNDAEFESCSPVRNHAGCRSRRSASSMLAPPCAWTQPTEMRSRPSGACYVDRDETTEAAAIFDRCDEGRGLDCLHDRLRFASGDRAGAAI
jgi:hypothetical protein